MTLRGAAVAVATVAVSSVALLAVACLFVLWTSYAHQVGVDAATYECEYGDAGQVN
jgi:uncharacterized membrane protein